MNKNKPVIFVVGSTATGKSEWALKLAREFGGVILNCDSVQCYSKVQIGAAKPTAEEVNLVPHYLLGYVDPPSESTAGTYCEDFMKTMDALPDGTPAFVVGGTGFYFMAIEKGMYPVTKISDEVKAQIAKELQEPGGPERLHAELSKVDPVYAGKVNLADHYRIGRGIELIRTQGKGVTQIQKEFDETKEPFPFPLLKIGPEWERDVLRERIALRAHKMLKDGLIDEVERLLDQGLENWAPLSSVGYKESIEFIKGRINEDELLEQITTNTRQLAKRQKTWFQRDKEIHWFDGARGYNDARAVVEKFLNSLTTNGPADKNGNI
ncbi:tRNA (adenosine(37)-N6)-dimethylallyltransferase MiaA [Bdellovibrio sp. SKB1291214]|uniref:tRNA (adenosine(37)-N6)-dimethylallyltransferase MiaA n=1 Tax=Bdellovibrio sp. SKB1291214 TaxID=1732569 RepID=UPI000B51C058|nr:tRNA (adenosine(37)-N6)-dimethylallyltransferase MiaA [Bdellovibrio sp. SKB1291214]UYL08468.1 tRNA (adenosine(37)-N6)-dimethylallyltransferase MiaA [Bdellovibrio sp. SKB1291214]